LEGGSDQKLGSDGTIALTQLVEGPQLAIRLDVTKGAFLGADGTNIKMYTNLENDWHPPRVDVQFNRREIAAGRWAEK